MMKATHKNWPATDPPRTDSRTSRYVFAGAVAGVLASLAALLAASTAYAATTGLTPVGCAVFGTTMTVLLSQPVGLAGLVAGAAVGGICALVTRHVK